MTLYIGIRITNSTVWDITSHLRNKRNPPVGETIEYYDISKFKVKSMPVFEDSVENYVQGNFLFKIIEDSSLRYTAEPAGTIEIINDRLDKLEELVGFNSLIEDLNDRVNELEDKINDITDDINDTNNRIDDLEERVTQLENP